jgi:hypothetical protein
MSNIHEGIALFRVAQRNFQDAGASGSMDDSPGRFCLGLQQICAGVREVNDSDKLGLFAVAIDGLFAAQEQSGLQQLNAMGRALEQFSLAMMSLYSSTYWKGDSSRAFTTRGSYVRGGLGTRRLPRR